MSDMIYTLIVIAIAVVIYLLGKYFYGLKETLEVMWNEIWETYDKIRDIEEFLDPIREAIEEEEKEE